MSVHRRVRTRRAAPDGAFRDRRARAYLYVTIFYLDAAEEGLRTAKPQNISARREIAPHARWRAAKMLPAFSDRLGVDLQADVEARQIDRMTLLDKARAIHYALEKAAEMKKRVPVCRAK